MGVAPYVAESLQRTALLPVLKLRPFAQVDDGIKHQHNHDANGHEGQISGQKPHIAAFGEFLVDQQVHGTKR